MTICYAEEKSTYLTPPSIDHYIYRWGCAASEILAESSCYFFNTAGVEGMIAYRLHLNCAIVFGDPLCAPEQMPLILQAFQLYCQQKNFNIIYLVVSAFFAKLASPSFCHVKLAVGEELTFDPTFDPQLGKKSHRLRNCIKYALNSNVTICEYDTQDQQLEQAILEVGQKWVKSRKGPQLYVGSLDFFKNRLNKRWFYAKNKEGKLVGMALLSRLEAYQGWLLKFLIVIPEAVRGTSELLMVSILDKLRAENCCYLTYGMVPGDSLKEIIGLSKISSWIAVKVFKFIRWAFKLDKRKAYWQKYYPTAQPVYVLFKRAHIGIREFRAIIKAFRIDL